MDLITFDLVEYEVHNTWMYDGFADEMNGLAFFSGYDDKIIRVFDINKPQGGNLIFRVNDNYNEEINFTFDKFNK